HLALGCGTDYGALERRRLSPRAAFSVTPRRLQTRAEGVVPRDPGELQAPVDRERRRGHDAVLHGDVRTLRDIDFLDAEVRKLLARFVHESGEPTPWPSGTCFSPAP